MKPRKPLKRSPIRRLGKRGKVKLEAMKLAKSIYFTQFSKCQFCGVGFDVDSICDVHHKRKRSLGGGDEMSNLFICHRVCHTQIHLHHYVAVRDSRSNALNGEMV